MSEPQQPPKTAPAIAELTIPNDCSIPSHTEYIIGGLPVHVYGVAEALEAAAVPASPSELVILHLVHPRTRSYEYTQRMATLLLAEYARSASSNRLLPPCVAATFDLRNHGHRIVSTNNSDWRRGNRAHGQDMATGILGSVQDVELVIRFLPAYLPQALTTQKANTSLSAPIWNIVSGVSQGGHVTWKVAAHAAATPDPGAYSILAAVPIIGAPDLTTLLVHRLLVQVCGLDRDTARYLLENEVFAQLNVPYASFLSWESLAAAIETAPLFAQFLKDFPTGTLLSSTFPEYWPRMLHQQLSSEDRATLQKAPEHVKNVFIVNSQADPLVPSWVSYAYAKKHTLTGRPPAESPADRTLYEKEGLGHIFTNDMADIVAKYIINVVNDRHKS
ncbi:uncharacterized protein SAPINGB_P001033 [Magnusiomyces paraingens]|uniref:AB hydrolase-1 domain-containing protein n=1 Tax=Magnusiomyces paraingens TaxID=2606893 RepID=A0A5E8B5I9_9ASCO|nr:uncharacterized protein SAPINGB_P001033 [Saprochaete ingens]VVT46074.1 unnamed protein product [Saprochaete ingens]